MEEYQSGTSEFSPIEELQETEEPGSNWGKVLLEILETLVLAVLLFVGINTVSARILVDGRSMEPSFVDGEYVIVNKLAYRFGDIQRGDVIIFPNPRRPDEDLIKRVIGLPGETIEVRDSQVWINGVALDEPYIKEQPLYIRGPLELGDDIIYVLGDNRNDSSDSHEWHDETPLNVSQVIGKAVFVYWPINMIGVVDPLEPQLILP
ncbi:MAG: signal peptidase I [Chloroflexi bacterium]|nr:MAG: signal peptidase I [Chloroflexota bacterium]MBL1197155.1 signal peptidase I [Chloroflexota bacterium]NOH14450.1 signal peptidase I [Chloroflexota bacterium]